MDRPHGLPRHAITLCNNPERIVHRRSTRCEENGLSTWILKDDSSLYIDSSGSLTTPIHLFSSVYLPIMYDGVFIIHITLIPPVHSFLQQLL